MCLVGCLDHHWCSSVRGRERVCTWLYLCRFMWLCARVGKVGAIISLSYVRGCVCVYAVVCACCGWVGCLNHHWFEFFARVERSCVCAWLWMVTGESCARPRASSLQCVCGRVRVCLGSCLSDHWFVSCARMRVMMNVFMYVRGCG